MSAVLIAVIGLAGAAVAGLFLMLAAAPERVLRAAFAAERRRAGLSRAVVDLPDGTRYVYLDGGRGTPLILLHGFGADKDNFTRIARFLTPKFRVIIPDHVGFGESSHPADADYRPEAQVARLERFADALGLSTIHLGGNSMGGQIAATWAARRPDRVASLWLLAPAGVWSAGESELHQVIQATGKNPLLATSEQEFAELFRFVMSKRPFFPRPLLDVLAQERIRNYPLERRIFDQVVQDSIERRVAGLATPALIVWGDEDRALTPAAAPALRSLMPNAEVVMMTGIGHVPMVEAPRRTAADYLRFRARLGA